jgi:hypothetical protein
VYLLDGTTLALAPAAELQQTFPPITNQHGRTAWPIPQLTVMHELISGAAIVPQIGPMYGPEAVSETAMVEDCLAQLPAGSLVMADAGFGILRVAQQTQQAGHDFLFRLTRQRFQAHLKRATLLEEHKTSRRWSLQWRPTAKELSNNPGLTRETCLEVFVHEIFIHRELTLHLITNTAATSTELASLYERRTDVETDLRNFKIVLQTEKIAARSVEMFQKELLMSVVAYNLVVQFRRLAAEQIKQPPRKLSFKRVYSTFRIFLLNSRPPSSSSQEEWCQKFEQALKLATKDKLPHRPDRRYPREAYQRRSKATQFLKRTPKPTENINENAK